MGAYVIETFHTSVHVLGSVTTTAALRSLPVETLLKGLLDPQKTLVIVAIWEQMSNLHNDGTSMYNGKVYDCNIEDIRKINVKIMRYAIQNNPCEFLSTQAGDKPEWWAGGSMCIDPIEKFSKKVTESAIMDAKNYESLNTYESYLHDLQQQLKEIGAFDSKDNDGNFDVTKEDDLATLFSNMIFYEAVFHGGIYMTREYISPIAMPMNSQFSPYLFDDMPTDVSESVDTIEDAMNYFATTDNLLRDNALPIMIMGRAMFSTGNGFNKAVEISQGPYYIDGNKYKAQIEEDIKVYQNKIKKARKNVMEIFGTDFAVSGEAGKGFLPGYYYPIDAAKPSGLGMTQTLYI